MTKGFTCECGVYHNFSMYVYAHWHEVLTHICTGCGAKHSVYAGKTTLMKKGRQKQTDDIGVKE